MYAPAVAACVLGLGQFTRSPQRAEGIVEEMGVENEYDVPHGEE